MTERVAPILRPPSSTGMAAGASSFRKTCERVARSDRINSYSSRGTERTPTTVLTSTGKNTINPQIRTLEIRPGPNQITKSGAIAMIGIA